MRVKEKESIFKGIIFALLCTSSSYAALSEQMTLNKFFENIVLIINFNHPYYGNIEFIKKLYSPLFDEIAFYGEEAHPDVFNCSTKNGYLLSNVIEDALMRFPNQSGYLFLQDDCILNFWNYLSLDKEKIWYAIAFNDGIVSNNFFYDIRNFNGQSYGKNWGGWDMPCAMSAAIIAFSHLQAGDCFMLHDNLGVNNVPIQMCEVFYIPQRFKNHLLTLNKIFKDVFCEIAVPSMLCCMDSINNWEKLLMFCGEGVGHANGLAYHPIFNNYPDNFSWIHPIKLSVQGNRDCIATIFNEKLSAYSTRQYTGPNPPGTSTIVG